MVTLKSLDLELKRFSINDMREVMSLGIVCLLKIVETFNPLNKISTFESLAEWIWLKSHHEYFEF